MLQSDWLSNSYTISHQYHPTSGLMQILQFDWLRYQMTISNSHRAAKLAQSSVTLSFVLFPNKCFLGLHLLTLFLPFLSRQLGDTKTIRQFTLKGHESIAYSASPHGLCPQPFRATGLIVNYSTVGRQAVLEMRCFYSFSEVLEEVLNVNG